MDVCNSETKTDSDCDSEEDLMELIGNTDTEKKLININLLTFRTTYSNLYHSTNYKGPSEFWTNEINWQNVNFARFVIAFVRVFYPKPTDRIFYEYYLRFLNKFHADTQKDEIKRVMELLNP